ARPTLPAGQGPGLLPGDARRDGARSAARHAGEGGRVKWVTWEEVGVDRIGSAWLIRRFVDPEAEFTFVPRGQSPLPADAEPFDIPGVRLSHHQGHASFHAILGAYDLTDPILRRIARMIDEADTVQDVAIEPAAPG